MGELPDLFLSSDRTPWGESFFAFQFALFGLCFLIVFVPTLLIGALFPLVTGLWAQSARTVGRGVGTAYAANAAGTIFGSLCGGLLLLPKLGAEHSLFLASGLSVAVASLWWSLAGHKGARRLGGMAVAWTLFLVVLVVVPRWNPDVMQAGVFTFKPQLDGNVEELILGTKLLYYEEGIDGVVSVVDFKGRISLKVNGKPDASTGRDMRTQMILGELGLFMHPNPKRALNIGLGSGVSAGAAANHDSLTSLDILEISPQVVTASEFFVKENGDVLRDPRSRLIVADARNFMLAPGEAYDVIVSEPSNPWVSGVSNLFTIDFFKLARKRLAPDGLMIQWFHTYGMSVEDVKCVLNTFASVFPNMSLWLPMAGDLILVGSEQAHQLDYARVSALLEDPKIRSSMQRVGVSSPADLINMLLMTDRDIDSYVQGALLNTDDRPRIEFGAPSNLYSPTTGRNIRAMLEHLGQRSFDAPIGGLVSEEETTLHAPFINLKVQTDANSETDVAVVSGVGGRWKVGRPDFIDQTKYEIQTLNQGLLRWQKGSASYQVLGQRAAEPPDDDLLRQAMGALLTGGVAGEGEVELPGGHRGLWGASPTAMQGRMVLVMAWQCTFSGEPDIRYLALQQFQDPGEEHWGEAAEEMASQLICSSVE
jgi:spermidine synthase